MSCTTLRAKRVVACKGQYRNLIVKNLLVKNSAEVRLGQDKKWIVADQKGNPIWTLDPTGSLEGGPKVSFDGVIDPSALVLAPQVSNPMGLGNEDALWIESTSGHLFRGSTDVETQSGQIPRAALANTRQAFSISSSGTGLTLIPIGGQQLIPSPEFKYTVGNDSIRLQEDGIYDILVTFQARFSLAEDFNFVLYADATAIPLTERTINIVTANQSGGFTIQMMYTNTGGATPVIELRGYSTTSGIPVPIDNVSVSMGMIKLA